MDRMLRSGLEEVRETQIRFSLRSFLGSLIPFPRAGVAAFFLGVLGLLWPVLGFAIPSGTPNITGVSPVSVAPGAAQFALTVNGSNFTGLSVVYWNTTALATTYIGRNQLTATVTADLVANASSGLITVINQGARVSNVAFFWVTGSTPTIQFVQSDLTIGSADMAVAIGDFNGDGIQDLVAGPASGSTISVFLGNGDGSYQAGITSTSPGQSSIAVGDFNGDGHLDVALASFNADSISILLGNGDGTFQAPTTYNTSDGYNVVAGDFNGDGKLDIAVAEYGDNNGVDVYLGNGDGTLQNPMNYATGSGPYGIVTADFNEDGVLDLAVTNHNGGATISILLGNGDGTFQTQSTYTVGNNPLGLAVGDFDGDGNPDLAVTSQSDGSISVLLGDCGGAFATRTTYSTFTTAFSVAIGDLNGDGNLDLAISGSNAKAVSTLLGNGDGTFQTQLTFGTGGFGWTAAMGDLDGSGRPGIAIADNSTGKVHVLLQGVVLTPSPMTFASQGVGTTSAAQTMTLTNATGGTVTISAISFTGTNAADFGETDNCLNTAVLSAGTCTFQVNFSPSIVGAETGTLSVADNAHGSPQTASLTGTGAAAPIATLAPAGLVFTTQNIATTSAAQTVSLTDTGNATLTGIVISITGGNSADFGETNNCASTLAIGIGCTISVTFTPSVVGSESASISIADNAAGHPQIVPLSGTGAPITPTLTWVTPAAITYGTALSATQLDATTSVAGTFAYTPAAGTVLTIGTQTLSTTFTPTDTETYTSAITTASLTVNTAALAFTASNVARAYGTANPTFTGTITGAVNGDTFTKSFSTTATVTSVPGAYPITPSITAGTHLADYNVTPTNGTLTVAAASSSTALAPVSAAFDGQALSLTATVTPAGSGVPTGNVTFLDGATTLGTGVLDGTGAASYSTATLSVGAHSFTVVYAGDSNFNTSTSAATSGTVNAAFTVAAPSAPVTAVPGSPATAIITIPPLGGTYNVSVVLSASGLPAGATATFNPPAVTPGSAGATSVLTVTFPQTALSAALIPRRNAPIAPFGLASVAVCLFWLRRKPFAKAFRASLLLGALAASAIALAGCSGGFGAGSAAPQAIVVTVTGTSGTLHPSTTVTFELR